MYTVGVYVGICQTLCVLNIYIYIYLYNTYIYNTIYMCVCFMCVLQVKDTCCGDKTDAAQCQIACEKFLANTPSINRHAANQEILDLCSAERRDARSATTATTSVELHRRCTRNTTARRPSSDGHKCKSDIDSCTLLGIRSGTRGDRTFATPWLFKIRRKLYKVIILIFLRSIYLLYYLKI